MKQWKTTTADSYFSYFIRNRDGACRRCGTPYNLTCSHYHMRSIDSTRYEPDNCIALCMECHILWEDRKRTEYRDHMISWLGIKRYLSLDAQASEFMKRSDAVQKCQNMLITYPRHMWTNVIM